MSAIYQELWDQVWQPCVDFAYALAAATKGEGAVGSSTKKMRVVEIMLPWLDDVAAELEDLGVDTLPEAEANAQYRGLRMRCRNGMARGRRLRAYSPTDERGARGLPIIRAHDGSHGLGRFVNRLLVGVCIRRRSAC